MKALSPVIPLAAFDRAVAAAAAALRAPGGVALVPTETVYGLVCRWADETAKARIRDLKERDREKPLGCFAASTAMLERAGVLLAGVPQQLCECYTPGPLTIIAPTKTGGTLGFRIPDHPFLSALLNEMKEPLAQTSANHSGAPDARNAGEALAGLTGGVDAAIDGGDLPEGALASTVVLATGDAPKILRQGALKIDL